MSSEMNRTEQQSANRRIRRSASLESIKKLNSFICSQHYNYILPALLACCKFSSASTSAAGGTVDRLQGTAGRCFDHITSELSAISSQVRQVSKSVPLNRLLLLLAVHLSVVMVFLQLSVCCYYLLYKSVSIPSGLTFLITCLYLIAHISYDCLQHFFEKADKKQQQRQQQLENGSVGPVKRLSRKDLLGKRTISNLSLF